MIRTSFLVLAFTVTAAAQPLQFGPAKRVAPFTAGTPGGDYGGAAAPRVNGFQAYWLHEGELWTEPLAGLPPRPDPSTAHSLGVNVNGYAETVNGPIILDAVGDGTSTFVRMLNAPESAATFISTTYPDAIECNSTRCLVSMGSGNNLAVVDTNAQLVKVLPPSPVARTRMAWATDPNGFLVLVFFNREYHALSIDNSGNIRADLKVDPFHFVAATFNGDRYAVFNGSGAGVKAFTMTVDGHLSPTTTVSTTPMLAMVVGWNGSEYLLAGPPNLAATIPEVVPPNHLSGLRIGPDLAPIGTPFQIAPSDGANGPTSIAWNGSVFYVVWEHTLGSLTTQPGTIDSTVEGAAISPAGDVVTRDLLSWGAVPQTWPHVAQGAQSVVVWSEFDIQSGTATLRYSIVGSGQAFTVATGFAIDVVPLGEDYLVVWGDVGRTRAAILTSDQKWSELALPFVTYANAAAAANHDRWLIAGSVGANIVTVAISREGTVSPPKVVAELPYVLGLASDGDRFFLASREHDFILDGTGSPILDKQPHFGASQVDFAGGVYGALSGVSFDRYDRDGNFLGSTKYSDYSYGEPKLSHIGSRFVIVYTFGPLQRAAIIASDGTLLVHDLAVPAVAIARTDATTSTAVDTHYPADMWNRPAAALFTESVSMVDTPSHRAVKH